MWNDADLPLGYLITFRCYGTWLHGDERGSIDRHNNVYGTPKYGREEHWKKISADRLKHPPVMLNKRMRLCVERAIRETCIFRDWGLGAVNVRTNHAHAVVRTPESPSIVLNALKANSTRQMREDGCWPHFYSPWSDRGSERWLWTEKQIFDAIRYVDEGQGLQL